MKTPIIPDIEKVDWGQIETVDTYKSVGDEYDLDFMDIMGIQEFPIELPEMSLDEDSETMVCVLEIADVYPGTDYDDTCITEIRLDLDTRYGNYIKVVIGIPKRGIRWLDITRKSGFQVTYISNDKCYWCKDLIQTKPESRIE